MQKGPDFIKEMKNKTFFLLVLNSDTALQSEHYVITYKFCL
jgi:hypothetical protein